MNFVIFSDKSCIIYDISVNSEGIMIAICLIKGKTLHSSNACVSARDFTYTSPFNIYGR